MTKKREPVLERFRFLYPPREEEGALRVLFEEKSEEERLGRLVAGSGQHEAPLFLEQFRELPVSVSPKEERGLHVTVMWNQGCRVTAVTLQLR